MLLIGNEYGKSFLCIFHRFHERSEKQKNSVGLQINYTDIIQINNTYLLPVKRAPLEALLPQFVIKHEEYLCIIQLMFRSEAATQLNTKIVNNLVCLISLLSRTSVFNGSFFDCTGQER